MPTVDRASVGLGTALADGTSHLRGGVPRIVQRKALFHRRLVMRKPLNWLISTAFTFGGVALLVASPASADNPANPANSDQKVGADQQPAAALALPAGAKLTEEPKVSDLTKPV